MPMLDIPNRARELGRIRMGEKGVSAKSGKSFPKRLSTWRLTGPVRDYLEAAAQVYGGTVTQWEDAPTEGDQWQVTIDTDALDVLVPPVELVDALSQWWEMWTGGGCDRRCNGQVETLGGTACVCPADIAQRLELAKEGKACKPTTRVAFILPNLPDLGVWRLEAHGMNAAVELPGSIAMLQRFAGRDVWVPARLRIDQRTAKKGGETHHFGVPVVEVPTFTFGALIDGSAVAQIAGQQQAVDSGQRALSAAPDTSVGEDPPPPPPQAPAEPAGTATPAGNGGGSQPGVFARSIRSTAKRLGIGNDLLAAIVEEVTGRPDPDAVHDPGHGNEIMAELRKVAEAKKAATA